MEEASNSISGLFDYLDSIGTPVKAWNLPYGLGFIHDTKEGIFLISLDNWSTQIMVLSINDVKNILEKVTAAPHLLEKSKSIVAIEQLTGVEVRRHQYFFGAWHVSIPDKNVSMINNPYGLRGPWSKTADEFEVLCPLTYTERTDGMVAVLSFEEVIDELQERGAIVEEETKTEIGH